MPIALIVGVGDGLSASLARALFARGYSLVLAARDTDKLAGLAAETKATTLACDASKPDDVASMFKAMDDLDGDLHVAIYNPSARVRSALVDLDPADVKRAIDVSAFGAFLVAQEAARRMLRTGSGNILFTGASAGVKGFAKSAPFAMGKFALRGLAQSMARELHPQNIHVGHVVIDGGIRNSGRTGPTDKPDAMLDPDAVAASYMALIDQHRSAWSWEIEIRPFVETF